MAIQAGQMSPDGRYRWDGVRWVPSVPAAPVSQDWRWVWNGAQWIPNSPAGTGNPRGLVLFRGFCIVVAVVYGGFSALALLGFALDGFDPAKLDTTSSILALTVAIFVFGLVYAAASVVAVVAPREPWAWVFAFVVIILGVLGITIFAAVPLIIYWSMPGMRAYYHMRS